MNPALYQKLLKKIPLFGDLSRDELTSVMKASKLYRVRSGIPVITEGKRGDAMFVLVEGSCTIRKNTPGHEGGKIIAQIDSPSVVGEMALIDGAPRSASVVTASESVLMKIDNGAFTQMRREFNPAAFKILRKLAATLCDRLDEKMARFMEVTALSSPAAEKEPEEEIRGNEVLHHMSQLPLFKGFSRSESEMLATVFMVKKFDRGQMLCAEGRHFGAFFIVVSGEVNSFKELPNGERVPLGTTGKGHLLGQKALIDGKPQPVTLEAGKRTIALQCDRDLFMRLFQGDSSFAYKVLDVIVTDLSHRLRGIDVVTQKLADVPPDKAGSVMDRLKRIGNMLDDVTVVSPNSEDD